MSQADEKVRTNLLLGRRLTLVAAGIAVLLALGYLFAGVWFAKIQLESEFKQNSEMAAATLASSLMEAMLTGNFHEIPDLLESAQLANSNIQYSFVTDYMGNIVAHTHSLIDGVPGDLHRLAVSHARHKTENNAWVLKTEKGDILHLAFPLEGRPGGYLHMGFSYDRVDEKLKVTARHLIGSMLVGLLLAALIGGMVYRTMARPISELTAAAAEFGAGDFSRRVVIEDERQDEVTLLAAAFNRMADQLQEKVSELELSRSDLAEEKSRVQAILDGMGHGVVVCDRSGKVGYMNEAASRIWNWQDGKLPDSYSDLHRGHTAAIEAFEQVAEEGASSLQVRMRLGAKELDLLISPGHRKDKDGPAEIIEISADITERLASERALAHAEKINVVGQLAAGVAHEINSPLDGAIEAASMIEKGEVEGTEAREFAKAQRAALERIAAIVYRLLTFSRRDQSISRPIKLYDVVSEAVELVRYRLDKAGLFVQMPDQAKVPYMIDGKALELSQVFVNLLSNAIDASPRGGKVDVDFARSNGWISVSVKDQGEGIPESAMDRIFTPFFTTKEVGKGTGLGLAVSKNIVEQFGGNIEISAKQPPWGACFTVNLPWTGETGTDN